MYKRVVCAVGVGVGVEAQVAGRGDKGRVRGKGGTGQAVAKARRVGGNKVLVTRGGEEGGGRAGLGGG